MYIFQTHSHNFHYVTFLEWDGKQNSKTFSSLRQHCESLDVNAPWDSCWTARRTSCSCPCPRRCCRTVPDTSWPDSCGSPSGSCSAEGFLGRCSEANPRSLRHPWWSQGTRGSAPHSCPWWTPGARTALCCSSSCGSQTGRTEPVVVRTAARGTPAGLQPRNAANIHITNGWYMSIYKQWHCGLKK